jgi:hypothetical protein
MVDELDDVGVGRKRDQPLLEPEPQVIDLGGFARAFSADTSPIVTKCCLLR